MTKDDFLLILKKEAISQGLEPEVLQAIISVESGWDPWALRFEPLAGKYVTKAPYYAKTNIITVETESMMQKCSFGLCQMMGFNFRLLGYTGPLTKTLEPEFNLRCMALFFKKNCDKYNKFEDKIVSYNSGSPRKWADGRYQNQDYLDKFMSFYRPLKKEQ